MRLRFGQHLCNLAMKDARIVVLDGDLANSTKTDLVETTLTRQFIQTGIAEQNMIGVAAGLAAGGMQPWVCTFTSFLTKRALDQIIVSVAQPDLDVKLIGAYSGLMNGKVGKTHQGIEDIALMRTIPNIKILCPADEIELVQMMNYAKSYVGPVYIRLTRESTKFFSDSYKFDSDYCRYSLHNGKHVTVFSTGTHTRYALEAVQNLAKDGIECTLVHVPVIKPIDKAAIIQYAKKTNAVVTVEDHSIIGGLGSAVAEILSENYPTFVLRIGIEDKNIEAGTDEELMNKYCISVKHIEDKVKMCLIKKSLL